MDELKTKQQVIEKFKQAEKVLVTVSKDPSVDALSAALGLTLLLDDQKKYATAIFSGETPPALAFLEPEKTFDDTTDSLRDFIIALNKEKADHLRYKVVDDAVKIFITPYKTTITEDDLEFSQGDYNVELVVALGVDSQEDLDAALDNHGQILHDASIVTISAGDMKSSLGGIDWHDPAASSLSEMVAGIVESFKDGKTKTDKGAKATSTLTKPIATALLTGIVAETERFSNDRTTSKSMTIAATLMAAGADQQLIANELQAVVEPEPVVLPEPVELEAPVEAPSATVDTATGGLSIQHDEPVKAVEEPAPEPVPEPEVQPTETLAELEARVKEPEPEPVEVPEPEIISVQAAAPEPVEPEAPLMGGVLNATTTQAEQDAKALEAEDQNRTILSHAYLSADETPQTPGQAAVGLESPAEESVASNETPLQASHERVIEPLPPSSEPEEIPVPEPQVTLPMPPPIPDFSQFGAGGIPAPSPASPNQILSDILDAPAPVADIPVEPAAMSSAYAFDDAGAQSATVPLAPAPLPVEPLGQPTSAYAAPAEPADPAQYQIPPTQ